jgi:Protein of unknown function (DUF1569)
MDQDKFSFIKNDFIVKIKYLTPDAVGKWGKMNAQQMVEHVSVFFKVSTNQVQFSLVTPEEQLPKFRAFLLSDKEFRENTKAPMLPEEPMPVVYSSLQDAIEEMGKQINLFAEKFSSGEIVSSQHPVFGDLNFDEWILLHYKHVTHHAKQFGLM